MERTGVTPRGAVDAADLAEVLSAPGPFLTLYLTTESDVENAAERSEARWKSVRRDLAQAGASDEALGEIDSLVPDAHLTARPWAVVADAGGVVHVEHGAEPPSATSGRGSAAAALPSAPVAAVVSAARHRGGRPDRRRHRRVQPPRGRAAPRGRWRPPSVAKAKPGGWSQPRYQCRAENSWEHNAQDVAGELVRLVEQFDAQLAVAAGDVRALELIRGALPERVLERLAVVDGSRGEDGSDDLFAARVRERVRPLSRTTPCA